MKISGSTTVITGGASDSGATAERLLPAAGASCSWTCPAPPAPRSADMGDNALFAGRRH